MSLSNVDQTIEYVRNIVENIQCAICDKTDGQRLRYSCGHTACKDCIIAAEECPICLTPPQVSNPQPKLDDALTLRVKNASVLLKACQNLFNTDVFKHKRLSEQLRIEKELFPECIQAPVKYQNKRKTSFLSPKNKENRNSTIFPGEEILVPSENITMENSVRYVQLWLKKNDKDFTRKPFRDLNVNTQLDHNTLRKNNYNSQSKNDENVLINKTNRKRSHYKTTIKNISPLTLSGNIKSMVNQHNSKYMKVKKESHQSNADVIWNETKTVCENDESGIFMDDPIVIDDSQEAGIDKDRNAWLAVLEANEKEIEPTSVVNLDYSDHKTSICSNKQTSTKSDGLQSRVKQNIKVPFYKKSYITETCTYCNSADNKGAGQPKEVKIIIDSVNFTTTVKILNDVESSSKLNTTNSVSVQTDICETIAMNPNIALKDYDHIGFTYSNEKDCKEDLTWQKSDTQSEDLFADEGKNIENEYYNQNNLHDRLVIAESDSDMEMERSGPLPVKVDVHRSCDESEYGILSKIVNIQQHDIRPRRAPRGLTPTSTDSSEKENFNPNRVKKHICNKKKKYAKK